MIHGWDAWRNDGMDPRLRRNDSGGNRFTVLSRQMDNRLEHFEHTLSETTWHPLGRSTLFEGQMVLQELPANASH